MERYPVYKDSVVEWIGKIPSHWEVSPAFALLYKRDISNKGLVEKNLLSLSYGKVIRKNIESSFGLLPESFETYQIVFPGDIVLRLTDLQNDKKSLRVGLVKEKGIITSAYLCLSPQDIHSIYAYYLLNSYDLQKVFYNMGGGVRQSSSFEDIKRLPILVPLPVEQRSIAQYLDHQTTKIDTLIAAKQHLLKLLTEKRRALITHTVIRGLNPGVLMRDSEIDFIEKIPKHWKVVNLKFLGEVRSGVAKGRDLGARETVSVPYLRVANVQDGYLDLSDVAEITVSPEEVPSFSLQKGDVLMNEGGDADKLGRGAVWDGSIEPCLHQNHVFAVRCHSIEPEWLTTVNGSDYAKAYFESRSKQSTNLASISATNIREFPVVVPPRQERRNIVDYVDQTLSKLDKLYISTQKTIELLQERRIALIAAAVTGQIRVPA